MADLKGTKTEANLKAAFAGESQARNKYTYFASVAKKAGFEQIAALFLETADQEKEHAKMWFKELAEKFRYVAAVEKSHEERYNRLLKHLQEGNTFKGESPLGWKCRNCGYIHLGEAAPEVCPTCAHPKAYFERKAENY